MVQDFPEKASDVSSTSSEGIEAGPLTGMIFSRVYLWVLFDLPPFIFIV